MTNRGRSLPLLLALAAGCSHGSSGGGWHEPVDPPLVGKATLSIFESDNGHCRWIQVDGAAGTRRPLAYLEDDCGDPEVTWSPDGRRAVIWNADYPEDSLVEVSLTSGAWRKLAVPPGTIDSLFYRDGKLYAWTSVDVPPPLLERLGLRPATSSETLEQAFLLDDGGWTPTQATPPDSALRAEYESSSIAAQSDDFPDKAPAAVSDKLSEDWGYDDWRQLGRSDAIVAYSDETPVGILLFKKPNGKWEDAEGASSDAEGGYSDITSIKVRDKYALLVGDSTRLYDLEAQRLIYDTTTSVQTVFWPLP